MTQSSGMWVVAQNGLNMKGGKTSSQRNSTFAPDDHPTLSSNVTPSLQSVAQLVCLFQKPDCACVLGACHLGDFMPVLTARLVVIKNASASCLVPECWIGFSSLVRNLSGVRCFRVVVSPFAESANNLSGHDRFDINVERDPYSVMWASRYSFHNFTFL